MISWFLGESFIKNLILPSNNNYNSLRLKKTKHLIYSPIFLDQFNQNLVHLQ